MEIIEIEIEMEIEFEEVGWSRIRNSPDDLDKVEEWLRGQGVEIREYDLSADLESFDVFVEEPEYTGEYRLYGGDAKHCFLEKTLEHFISFKLVMPQEGDLCIDVGSCKSPAPKYLERTTGAKCYAQDLVYPAGVGEKVIGSSAESIPLPNGSVDSMFLHCTFEHFEGKSDIGYIRECGRLLKKGGKAIILPLYLNLNYCNVTGEVDSVNRENIEFDPESDYYSIVPEWKNRFGRHYSPTAFFNRVVKPSREHGLSLILYRCKKWDAIDERLWLRWILVLES